MKLDIGKMFFGYGLMAALMAVAERLRDDNRFIILLFLSIIFFSISCIGEVEQK